MAQRYDQADNTDRDNFETNANRRFGGSGNEYDRNDNVDWHEREALRHGFVGRSSDPLSVSQRYGTASSSFGRGQWDSAVDRAVHQGAPAYNDRGSRQDQPQVSHRGRGPKNYQRSDERIREHICELLTEDPGIDASSVEVECADGIVTLKGKINTRRMKHRVEDLVADTSGVKDVRNHLKVRMGSPHGDDAAGGAMNRDDPMDYSWPPV